MSVAEKLGRKSNKQRVADVGRRLVESGQYPTIKATLCLYKIPLMKLLSRNTRGINNLRKMKILCQKIKMTNPAIILLQETKCLANYIQDHRGKIWDLFVLSNPGWIIHILRARSNHGGMKCMRDDFKEPYLFETIKMLVNLTNS